MNITDDMKRRAERFPDLSPLTKASVILVAEESKDSEDVLRKLGKVDHNVARFVREILGKPDRTARDSGSDKKFDWPRT